MYINVYKYVYNQYFQAEKSQVRFLSHKQRISHRKRRLSHVNLLWVKFFPLFSKHKNLHQALGSCLHKP